MAPENGSKRRRNAMSSKVETAVNDILHGVTVDSHTEWLQREYLRLMRREAKTKQMAHESKLKEVTAAVTTGTSTNGNGDAVSNRSAEQHGEEEHGERAAIDAEDDN